jgi:pseudomonalisin
MPFAGYPAGNRRSRHTALALALALVAALAHSPARAAPADPAPAPRIRAPIDESRRVELPGHRHPALRESRDQGAADPRQRAERILLLLRSSPAQQAALERFLHDVQTPASAGFRHWLTPAEFGRRFGVAPADLAKVEGWLRAKGFTVETPPAGGRSILFSGTVGQLERAFAPRMHRFDWRGETHLAASANPTIPAALAPVVAGFASLHDFRHQPQIVRAALAPAFTDGSGRHFLAPGDFATIYDLDAPYAQGVTGSGRSIAVLGRSSVLAADLSTFRAAFGLAANPPTTLVVNGATPARGTADELESDLDLEWAGAVAPAAAVKFVTAASTATTDGIALAAQYAVGNNVADVITLSYGSCEAANGVAGTTFFHQLWQQAAAQGVSVFVSSGDSGAAGCDASNSASATQGLGVNALCSSPYSTCVGGTEFSADVAGPATYWAATNAPVTQSSALSYIGESVWNESGAVAGGSALYASGGGQSLYFGKPAWQYIAGLGGYGRDGMRDVPDVALNAALHDAYLIYTSYGYSTSTLAGVSGTSAATPSMAGVAALVAQKAGGRLGNVNAALYGLSALQQNGGAAVLHRIGSGNNTVPGITAGFAAGPGDVYNLATGLGSIDGAQLIAHWADLAPATTGIAPDSALLPAGETVGAVALTTAAATAWTASPSAAWLSITPGSGTGSTGLSYTAQANPAASPRTGTITIAGQTLTITQAAAPATPAAPLVSVSPAALAFGAGAVGAASGAQRLIVGNGGNAAVSLSYSGPVGTQAADFSAAGNCPLSATTLQPGQSCYLDVTFRPTAIGTRAASLNVAPQGQAAIAVSLSGTGTAAAAISADVPLPPWALALLAASLVAALPRVRSGS